MNDLIQPLIHKAAVHEITIHVARAGLSIGDEAELHSLPDGRIGVFVRLTRRFLGLIPRQVTVLVGKLGPNATDLISSAVMRGEALRVRVVGLTPEHLAGTSRAPEIHVSVWGDPRHLTGWTDEGAPYVGRQETAAKTGPETGLPQALAGKS